MNRKLRYLKDISGAPDELNNSLSPFVGAARAPYVDNINTKLNATRFSWVMFQIVRCWKWKKRNESGTDIRWGREIKKENFRINRNFIAEKVHSALTRRIFIKQSSRLVRLTVIGSIFRFEEFTFFFHLPRTNDFNQSDKNS